MNCIGALCALPKPRSTHYGPEPSPPAGGWPAYKGKPGPKQIGCGKQGGDWIGPTGKKWCQMPAPGGVQPPSGVETELPTTVTGPSDTTGAEVDTVVQAVASQGGAAGAAGGAAYEPVSFDAEGGFLPGPAAGAITQRGPAEPRGSLPLLIGIVAVVGGLYFFSKTRTARYGVARARRKIRKYRRK